MAVDSIRRELSDNEMAVDSIRGELSENYLNYYFAADWYLPILLWLGKYDRKLVFISKIVGRT
ncbi:hypothetical protein CHS0354_041317 [Potamilus streckersoni]|uniref:Uncharacterized protein n=1 Tax=Potamilus streckersoni TaxID=2493646 RepID=A0AAE0SF01_9BIVA|nr:hypothetical protein CHS0354_041317 [Potamilus streckersoni]